jgi:hypothetical protein
MSAMSDSCGDEKYKSNDGGNKKWQLNFQDDFLPCRFLWMFLRRSRKYIQLFRLLKQGRN